MEWEKRRQRRRWQRIKGGVVRRGLCAEGKGGGKEGDIGVDGSGLKEGC